MKTSSSVRVQSLRWPKQIVKSIYSNIVKIVFSHRSRRIQSQANGPKSLLIIRTDGLGDLILSTPMFKHLREAFGGYHISLLTRQEWVDLFEDCPYVDEVIPWSIKTYQTSILYRLKFLTAIRNRKFDLALHPVYSREPLSDEVLCSCLADRKIGFDGDLGNIDAKSKSRNDRSYTQLLPGIDVTPPEIERNRLFIEQVVGRRIAPGDFGPELWLTQEDRAHARRLLAEAAVQPDNDLVVALFPAASWQGKAWSAENYAQLTDRLVSAYGARILVCGGPSDLATASKLISGMQSPAANLVGKTRLRQLAAVLELCDLFIGNDSGPLHVAVAAGTPTLGIVGGGHFGRFYPYGDQNLHRMVHKKMDCYNCNWQCIHETVRCIQEISCDEVWRVTQRMMAEVVFPARESRLAGSGMEDSARR